MSEIETAIADCKDRISEGKIANLKIEINKKFEEIRKEVGIEDENFGERLYFHTNENNQYAWLYKSWETSVKIADLAPEEKDTATERLNHVRDEVFSILEIEVTDKNIEKTNELCALTSAKMKLSKLKCISLGVRLDNEALEIADEDEEEKLMKHLTKITSEAQELLDEIEVLAI